MAQLSNLFLKHEKKAFNLVFHFEFHKFKKKMFTHQIFIHKQFDILEISLQFK